MKKMLIAAAIVCAAAFSQASTVSWSAALVDIDGVALSSSAHAEFDIVCTIFDATGANVLAENTTGNAINAISGAAGGKWTGAALNTTYQALVMITDKDGNSIATDKFSFTTTGSATYKANFASNFDQAPTAADGYGWTAAAVPEPTSGLLLLLGMAGLALRRRRA